MRKSIGKTLTAMALVLIMLSIMMTSAVAYGPSTMYTCPSGTQDYGCLSPRTIQLAYSGSNNGKMYTTFECTSTSSYGVRVFPIYESTNNGQSWTKVGDVKNIADGSGWSMRNCPELFELPTAVGNMTAGTMICIGNACDSERTATHMEMYKSTDLGRTWTYVSTVTTGGTDTCGTNSAIWEPCVIYANSKLICYISDERDPNHSQKLDHYTSTDGVNWNGPVDDVVWPDSTTRPGMPVVSKMANGNYIMTYEVAGQSNTPCQYKINNNPETGWNSITSPVFGYGGSPYNTVLSDGRVILQSCGSADLLINTKTDGTGSWVNYQTPITAGYNREILQLASGRMFISSCGGFWSTTPNTVTYCDMVCPLALSGSYSLVNVKSGKSLGINAGSLSNGGTAVQWTSQAAANQMWQMTTNSSGYKVFTNVNSGLVLGVNAASTADGAQGVQWTANGSNDQQWTLTAVGSNYKIVNRNSGKCLGVYQGSTADGANLVQWTDNGSTDQQWQLVAN